MQLLFKFATACALTMAVSSAAEIQFTQDGWSTPGATLFVSFSGNDQDQDGVIAQAELTAFQAAWTSPLAGSTVWGLGEIQPDGFFFTDLNNYLFFLTNAEFSLIGTAFEGEALSSVFDAFLFPVDSSVTPAAVPEPEGLAVIAVTVAVIGRLLWRRAGDGKVGS